MSGPTKFEEYYPHGQRRSECPVCGKVTWEDRSLSFEPRRYRSTARTSKAPLRRRGQNLVRPSGDPRGDYGRSYSFEPRRYRMDNEPHPQPLTQTLSELALESDEYDDLDDIWIVGEDEDMKISALASQEADQDLSLDDYKSIMENSSFDADADDADADAADADDDDDDDYLVGVADLFKAHHRWKSRETENKSEDDYGGVEQTFDQGEPYQSRNEKKKNGKDWMYTRKEIARKYYDTEYYDAKGDWTGPDRVECIKGDCPSSKHPKRVFLNPRTGNCIQVDGGTYKEVCIRAATKIAVKTATTKALNKPIEDARVKFICDSINIFLGNSPETNKYKRALGKRLVEAFNDDGGYGAKSDTQPWNDGNKITWADSGGGGDLKKSYDFEITQTDENNNSLGVFTVEEKSAKDVKKADDFNPEMPWAIAVQFGQINLKNTKIGENYAKRFFPFVQKLADDLFGLKIEGNDFEIYKNDAFDSSSGIVLKTARKPIKKLYKDFKDWQEADRKIRNSKKGRSLGVLYKDDIHAMNEEFEQSLTTDEKQDLVKKMATKLKKSEGQKDYWIQVAGLVPTETSKEKYLVQYDTTNGYNKPELRKIFDFDESSSTCKFLWSKNDDVYIPDIDDVKIKARYPNSVNIGPQLDVRWMAGGEKVGKQTSLRFRNTSFANFSTDYK